MARPIPLNIAHHGHRFWRRFDSFDFARDVSTLPVVLAEISQISRTFPILFYQNEGQFLPHAILNTDPSQDCCFVAKTGEWLAPYVPAALRSHPFQASLGSGPTQFTLMVDDDSPYVTDDIRDEPFFDPLGDLSPALAEVLVFLQEYDQSLRAAALATKALHQANLLIPAPDAYGLSQKLTRNSWIVDRDALQALDGIILKPLMQTGALKLAYAHQISLESMPFLQKTAATRAEAWTSQHTSTMDMVGSFLSALAEAHEGDKEDAIASAGDH